MKAARPCTGSRRNAGLYRVALGLGLTLFPACGSSGVTFNGHAAAPSASPGELLETEQLPRGVERLGHASAECRPNRDWTAFQGRSLVDVDCSERRLRLMLRETASLKGANVLSGLHCETGKSSRCSAVFGRSARPTRSTAPRVLRGDVRGTRGSAVRVDFTPLTAHPARPPREDSTVRDLPSLPPSHVLVGSFSTECAECSELETRAALLLAAGQLGASDVVGLRCHPFLGEAGAPGFRCLGSAAVTRTGE